LLDATVEETGAVAFAGVLTANVMPAFLFSQAVFPPMLAQGGGRIVSISSCLSQRPSRRYVAYSSAKAALETFTRGLAVEWGPHGIRANIVAPGQVRTALNGPALDKPGVEERVSAKIPAKRIGRPSDVAHAVLYLSGQSSDFVNGAVLSVDGGYSVRAP
ncbi:MAG TPA: SDR family oxidoreductase, partial [Egibacteraceae bacterium]|nr:SDR family oxidoreductase [Egibacteraceae bacterium]